MLKRVESYFARTRTGTSCGWSWRLGAKRYRTGANNRLNKKINIGKREYG
jgi:hypothetical protein